MQNKMTHVLYPTVCTIVILLISGCEILSPRASSSAGSKQEVSSDSPTPNPAVVGHKAAGKAFLAKNAKANGVVTTSSGLQYKILRRGVGRKPGPKDSVSVHYRGTFIDGNVFDATNPKGAPITFSVGGVIRGFSEGLQLMKVGAKWRLFIPADLAYGPNGSPPRVPPDAVLIFDLELIQVPPPAFKEPGF